MTGFVVLCVIMLITLVTLQIFANIRSLDGIKSRTVGDGQHGSARWATKSEIRSYYKHIPFTPEKWREQARRGDPPKLPQGWVVGAKFRLIGPPMAQIETDDIHIYQEAAAGWYKTTGWLAPNLEYALAAGLSTFCMDTKGDLARLYGNIAANDYHANVVVLDLRNPLRSHGDNLLHLVNKYMDMYHAEHILAYRAKAERYAKVLSKTIISPTKTTDYGGNTYFYEAAEGLLAAVILIISEYALPQERHIISVAHLVQELMSGDGNKVNQFAGLLSLLPPDNKARLFAGAAVAAQGETVGSILSTALSRLTDFLDSEMEQLLCFDSAVDAEDFCTRQTAVFLILPEENPTTHFIASLMVEQLYREILTIADERGGKLANRVLFLLDEFGTIPPISSASMMFSAGRSRGLGIAASCQSRHQLIDRYGQHGAATILKNCQITLAGGFAALDDSADEISKALGSRTVQAGSVGRGKQNTENLQMTGRPLMSPDELRQLPKGSYVRLQAGHRPSIFHTRYYTEWGIHFPEGSEFRLPDSKPRKVSYASREAVMMAILEGSRVTDAAMLPRWTRPELKQNPTPKEDVPLETAKPEKPGKTLLRFD